MGLPFPKQTVPSANVAPACRLLGQPIRGLAGGLGRTQGAGPLLWFGPLPRCRVPEPGPHPHGGGGPLRRGCDRCGIARQPARPGAGPPLRGNCRLRAGLGGMALSRRWRLPATASAAARLVWAADSRRARALGPLGRWRFAPRSWHGGPAPCLRSGACSRQPGGSFAIQRGFAYGGLRRPAAFP